MRLSPRSPLVTLRLSLCRDTSPGWVCRSAELLDRRRLRQRCRRGARAPRDAPLPDAVRSTAYVAPRPGWLAPPASLTRSTLLEFCGLLLSMSYASESIDCDLGRYRWSATVFGFSHGVS